MKIQRTDTCWLWIGGRSSNGYGTFTIPRTNRNISAHRFAYQHWIGPIPDGLTIDHLCRVRRCVNPAHLEAVSGRTNILRSDNLAAQNARKTHCKAGHPYDLLNTHLRKDGARTCRSCERLRHQRRERALRAQGFTRTGPERKWHK